MLIFWGCSSFWCLISCVCICVLLFFAVSTFLANFAFSMFKDHSKKIKTMTFPFMF